MTLGIAMESFQNTLKKIILSVKDIIVLDISEDETTD